MTGPKTQLGKFRVSVNPIKYTGSALRRSPNSLISKTIDCNCNSYNHNPLCQLRYSLYRKGLFDYSQEHKRSRVMDILKFEDLCALLEGDFAIRYSKVLKGQKTKLSKEDHQLVKSIIKLLVKIYKLKYWKSL